MIIGSAMIILLTTSIVLSASYLNFVTINSSLIDDHGRRSDIQLVIRYFVIIRACLSWMFEHRPCQLPLANLRFIRASCRATKFKLGTATFKQAANCKNKQSALIAAWNTWCAHRWGSCQAAETGRDPAEQLQCSLTSFWPEPIIRGRSQNNIDV